VTLLHLAENLARVGPKRVVRYRMPVLRDGARVWEAFEDFDTSNGIVGWGGEDYFGIIVREYVRSGKAQQGWVGTARSILLDASDLVGFAVAWMEGHFQAL